MSKKYFIGGITFLFFIIAPFVLLYFFDKQSDGNIKAGVEVQADFLHTKKRYALVFFGYVGCKYICTPDLEKLAQFYESLEFQKYQNEVEVFFVNLKPEVDSTTVDLFAKSFHPEFQGVYLGSKELRRLDRKYEVYFSRDINDREELNHSDNLYLLSKEDSTFTLQNIFLMHPLHGDALIRTIEVLQKR